MAKVNVHGFIGQDAKEEEVTSKEQVWFVIKFSVAESEYKGKDDNGEPVYESTWFNCAIWNSESQPKRVELLKSGRFATVFGDLKARLYANKDDEACISNDIRIRNFSDIGLAPIVVKEGNVSGQKLTIPAKKKVEEVIEI
jgi:single-stranded DNA-binding protein